MCENGAVCGPGDASSLLMGPWWGSGSICKQGASAVGEAPEVDAPVQARCSHT